MPNLQTRKPHSSNMSVFPRRYNFKVGSLDAGSPFQPRVLSTTLGRIQPRPFQFKKGAQVLVLVFCGMPTEFLVKPADFVVVVVNIMLSATRISKIKTENLWAVKILGPSYL